MNQEVSGMAEMLEAVKGLPPADSFDLEFPLGLDQSPSVDEVIAYCESNDIKYSQTVRIQQFEGKTTSGEPGIGFNTDIFMAIHGTGTAIVPLLEAIVAGKSLGTSQRPSPPLPGE